MEGLALPMCLCVVVRRGRRNLNSPPVTPLHASETPPVAISGDIAVVGATLDPHAGSFSGSAYVFVRSGTTWTEEAKLTASDGANIGWSVAVSGDTAVIGNSSTSGGPKAIYVFVRSGTTWAQEAKLTTSNGAKWEHCYCRHAWWLGLRVCTQRDNVGAGGQTRR